MLAQLRQVVERLEGGNLTLEQSLAAFEEGVRLSRSGAQMLDAAEQRVELLLREGANETRTVPFAGAGQGSSTTAGEPGGGNAGGAGTQRGDR